MISWNECDARFAGHDERVGRAERLGGLAPSVAVTRRRGITATVAGFVGQLASRAGAAVGTVERRTGGDRRIAEAK